MLAVSCTKYDPITGNVVSVTHRCVDSDGEDYYTKGAVDYTYTVLGKETHRASEDNCKNKNLLVEFVCKFDRPASEKFNCTCRNGACVRESVCGNNIAESSEECDGTDLKNMYCEDFGLTSGTLKCNSKCEIDVSGCKVNLKEELVGEPKPSCSDYDFNCDGITDKADAKIVSDMWHDGKTFDIATVTAQSCKQFASYLGDLWKKGINTIPIDEVTRVGAEVEKCKINCIQAQPRGDVNADGILDQKDANLILSISVGNMDKPNNLCCVDINRDGAVNSADAILVMKGGNLGICPMPISCLAGQKIGDATGDGVMDLEDNDAIMETSVGLLPMPSNICCADLNKDGKIDSGDAIYVQQIIKGTKTSPGICTTDTCGDDICQKGEDDYCPLCITSMPPCYNSCTVGTCPQDCRKPSNAVCFDPDGKDYNLKSTAVMYTPSSGTVLKSGQAFVTSSSVIKLYYMDRYKNVLRFYIFGKDKYVDSTVSNGAGQLYFDQVYHFKVDYNKKQITFDETVTLAEITSTAADKCIYLDPAQTQSSLVEAYCGVGILKQLVDCTCMNGVCISNKGGGDGPVMHTSIEGNSG